MLEVSNSPDTAPVYLEQAVHELEERLITNALLTTCGSVYEASRLLGLRTEDALWFILQRHPKLSPLWESKADRKNIAARKVVRLGDWVRHS